MFAVDEFWTSFAQHFAATIIYVLLGLLFFAVAYGIIARMSPYSMKKEIEEEKKRRPGHHHWRHHHRNSEIIAAAVHG